MIIKLWHLFPFKYTKIQNKSFLIFGDFILEVTISIIISSIHKNNIIT